MNFFPSNARERWLLFLFPFKAYLFIAPVCFVAWELATSGRSIRGARDEAAGMVGLGYMVCLLVFVIVGLLFCIFRKIELVLSATLFGVLAFFFPIMIYDNAGMFVITISVLVFGTKFARDRNIPRPLAHENEAPFECPACGTTVPVGEQKCPHCAWTYLA